MVAKERSSFGTERTFVVFPPSRLAEEVEFCFDLGSMRIWDAAAPEMPRGGLHVDVGFAVFLLSERPDPFDITPERFPDQVFRQYVSENYSQAIRALGWRAVKDISVSRSFARCEGINTVVPGMVAAIHDLSGIEYFTHLRHLDCRLQPLEKPLDMAFNVGEIFVECRGCDLVVPVGNSRTMQLLKGKAGMEADEVWLSGRRDRSDSFGPSLDLRQAFGRSSLPNGEWEALLEWAADNPLFKDPSLQEGALASVAAELGYSSQMDELLGKEGKTDELHRAMLDAAEEDPAIQDIVYMGIVQALAYLGEFALFWPSVGSASAWD